MQVLSSRCFLLLLLSTQRGHTSLTARESDVSNPLRDKHTNGSKYVESSTGKTEITSSLPQSHSLENVTGISSGDISDQTQRNSHDSLRNHTQALLNALQDNATITDEAPDQSTSATVKQPGISRVSVGDLTTQPFQKADVVENITCPSINAAMSDPPPTGEVEEITTDSSTTVKNTATAVVLTNETSVNESSSFVSKAVCTAKCDSIPMTSPTNNNLSEDSSTMHDSSTTVPSESNKTSNMIEESDANKSEKGNKYYKLSSILAFLVITIGIVSLVFNTLNIVIYCRQKTASVVYIIMLSTVDVMDCLIVISIMATTLVLNVNRRGLVFINWVIIRTGLKQFSHTLNAIISADRFFVLFRELKSKNCLQNYPKTVTGIIAIIFLVTTVLRAFIGTSYGKSPSSSTDFCVKFAEESSNMTTQDPSNLNTTLIGSTGEEKGVLEMTTPGLASTPEFFSNTIFMFVNMIYSYLTLFAITVFNIAALVFLRRRAQEVKRLNISTSARDSEVQQRKQTVILLTMTSVYVLLSIPYFLIRLVNETRQSSQEEGSCMGSIILYLGLFTESLASSSDFLVFLTVSRSFRVKLKRVCACCSRRRFRCKTDSTH